MTTGYFCLRGRPLRSVTVRRAVPLSQQHLLSGVPGTRDDARLRAIVGRFLSRGRCSAELAIDVLLEAQETVLRARFEDVDLDADFDFDSEVELFEDEEDE
jgi:hypothetical protein